MSVPTERIPIPWPQRRELLRERLLPIACFIATILACGWLWQRQAAVAPVAIGEVYGASVELKAPYEGEVIAVGEGGGDETWPLFAKVTKGDVVVRIQRPTGAGSGPSQGQVVDVSTPLAGSVTARPALVGQHVRRGDVLLKVTSKEPEFILCHVPFQWQEAPKAGAEVAVRLKGRSGATWILSTIEAAGPAVETAPAYPGLDAMVASRGVPLRVAIPKGMTLIPGSLVEVRLLAMGAPH
jgi:hypothetical protein